jgi:MFS family permease
VAGEWVSTPVGSVMLGLFLLILLTRGLGQSALSVVSLALVGKTAGRRSGPALGVYSALVAAGFMAAFGAVKYAVEERGAGWRTLWAGIGVTLLAFGLLAWPLVRPTGFPRGAGERDGGDGRDAPDGLTLGEALRTPAFWVFGLASSLYGLIAAGVSLFNQSILAERGFDRSVFLTITTVTPLIGLAANLVTGWLATRWGMGRLMAVAMLVLTAALLCFPLVKTLGQVYAYAAAMGIAGGMVTVLFFAVWGHAFGTRHLGQIQGAAQTLTVLASAVGPLILAAGQRAAGSYVPSFQVLAAAAAVLGVAAWFVPLPRRPTPATGFIHDLDQ